MMTPTGFSALALAIVVKCFLVHVHVEALVLSVAQLDLLESAKNMLFLNKTILWPISQRIMIDL